MSFNDFVHKYGSENETSDIKVQNITSSVALNDVRIYLGEGPFITDMGIVILHPFQGIH